MRPHWQPGPTGVWRLTLAFVAATFAAPAQTEPSGGVSSLSLEELMNVRIVSAALHKQELRDAPASANVITAADIRKYGYRTIGEALDSVRGIYLSTDRTYSYLGSRGLSIPGDFGTRYLLLVNSHPIGDTLLEESNFLDQTLPIDMDLIQQIEVVHGPASALYGSNAVLCTINVITKQPGQLSGATVSAEGGALGERKLQTSYAGKAGGVNFLVSGSAFNFSGERSIYFKEYDSPETNFGRTIRNDGQRGYHFFANASWKRWTFTAMIGQREKQQPISFGETIFNSRGTREFDGRSFFESVYSREWSRTALEWRTSFDWYHYRGVYHYQGESGAEVIDNRECDCADWFGSKLIYRIDTGRAGTTTFGADARVDARALLENFDNTPVRNVIVHVNKPDQQFGFLAQQEFSLTRAWKAVAGARYDISTYRAFSLSPRAGIIWERSKGTNLKFLYGRSFRNPTAYELFYHDGVSAAANPNLKPEHGHTFEFAAERKLRSRLRLAGSVYRTGMRSIIVTERIDGDLVQFQNSQSARLLGVNAELDGKFGRGIELGGSIARQSVEDGTTHANFPNSPRDVGKLRFAFAPRRWLTASGAVRWVGGRTTMAGAQVPWMQTADLTFTTNFPDKSFDLQFGIRNLFDRRFFDPIALNGIVDAAPRPGRTFFLRVLWHQQAPSL